MECYPEPFTGKFTTARVEPVSEKEEFGVDPNDEVDEDPNDDFDDDTEEMTIPFSVLALCYDKGVAGELLVDPVYHGWRRALRIVGYLQSWISIYKHKSHNEVQFDCKICMMGNNLWDPLTEEKRAQNYFFRWGTDRIKLNLKPELVSRYVEQQGILYEDGRLGAEFQFKAQDLDQVDVDYIDKHEILNPVPIVWWMLIHTKTNMHAALEPTIKEIYKMRKVLWHWKGLKLKSYALQWRSILIDMEFQDSSMWLSFICHNTFAINTFARITLAIICLP